MNERVNGTMEEPMELSLPASPKTNEQTSDEVAQENSEIGDNAEANTASGDATKQDPPDDALQDSPDTNEAGSSDKLCSREIPSIETEESSQENSTSTPVENLYSISTDSNTGSIDSSQTKSMNHALEKMDIDSVTPDETLDSNMKVAQNVDIDFEQDSLGSEISAEPMAEDTVSITSGTCDENADDENSQESHTETRMKGLVLTRNDEKENNEHGTAARARNQNSTDTSCRSKASGSESKVQLRRSSRAIKRRRYDDDMENGDEASDVEVVPAEELQRRRPKPIVVNDTKALVQIAAKQMRTSQPSNHRKEPTVVIIDTNSPTTSSQPPRPIPVRNPVPTTSAMDNQSLYQSIVARGTSVTPVSVRANSSRQCASTSVAGHPPILPSLTDDMYVVEAPSFIVPYVYEKPSVMPFREFVDEFGNEIEEQRVREENEQNDNDNNGVVESDGGGQRTGEQAAGDQPPAEEGGERETRGGENVGENEDDRRQRRDERRAERRRARNDDDDVSWDGESSTDSDDEIVSDEEGKTVVIKDKVDSMEEMKDITGLTVEKVVTGKSDNYFDCSLGKFFMNIGLSFVQEFVQNDLLKQQNRKLFREKKAGHSTRATETSIASLMKNLEFSKKNNAPYKGKQKKCEFCSFKSESLLVMAHHLETPHMKNNVYKCNYCTFEIRSPHDILYHMEAEHNIRGKLERAPAYHQCANCPFEDNGKGKLARHLIPCSKKFKPEANLAPPIEWEPPAKIPKMTRSRNSMMSPYPSTFQRSAGVGAGVAGAAAGAAGVGRLGALAGVTVTAGASPAGASTYRPRGRSPLAAPTRGSPVLGAPLMRGGVMIKHTTPVLMPTNFPVANNGKSMTMGKSIHQPSISITPLPRQPQPVHPQPAHHSKSTFVICEICDGYIKDLEQLRNHMQWIHKVKIHPKMIYNRPPLNCQKCQCRFFTDQGLERHLLGSHGLVTSSMQEAANKGKDAGRCPVCGRVYQWKLLNHVARDHNLTLKPAHLSYKCTVCTATFGMYKQFENHVYSAHSVVAKRVMDKSKVTTNNSKPTEALLKPLKINDEITIIPQPVKAPINDK